MTREDAINKWIIPAIKNTWNEKKCTEIINALKKEPKTGHWVYKLEDWNKWTCSECGWSKRTDVHVKLGYSYCPNCGAKILPADSEKE